jgi:hypothetical protein
MKIKKLLAESRKIWGKERLNLSQIIVRMGKVFGDICRWERNAPKDRKYHTKKELKKELGNLIFSTIKFCDELGFNPEDCIEEAIKTQRKNKKILR